MSVSLNEYLENLLNNLDLIKPQDIPNIDLYMDQVTTFMEKHLGGLKRFDEDKILTKTMINNYAKNDLLPPPEKKKYSKDHILLLTFIYYFKNFLSIGDIKTLTSTLTERYFKSSKDICLESIYSELLGHFPDLFDNFKNDVHAMENLADNCFNGTSKNNKDLKDFLLIALLGIDVYMKKQLIETIIDSMDTSSEKKTKKSPK